MLTDIGCWEYAECDNSCLVSAKFFNIYLIIECLLIFVLLFCNEIYGMYSSKQHLYIIKTACF